jgi:hypothetical protein
MFDNRKKFIGAVAFFGIFVVMPAFGQNAQKNSAVNLTKKEFNQLNEDSAAEVADQNQDIQDAIDKWLESRRIEVGVEGRNGELYYSATSDVEVSPSHPAWVKSRQTAFDKAILAIRANFIKDQFGRTVNRIEQSLNQDDSSNNREFKDKKLEGKSQIAAIWDKALAVSGGKLDQLLNSYGIDPSELNAVPPAQRKDLFAKKFIKSTITRAMGDSSGILVKKTYEANNSKGNFSIGVIALYSPNLKQIAYDIAHGSAVASDGIKGRNISSWHNYPPETLSKIFGLRLVNDENGEFVLLSFGQWGFSFKGKNSNRIKRARRSAAVQAEQITLGQITNFMNSSLALNNSTETGEIVENYLLKQGDDTIEKDITTIVDKISNSVKQRSSGKIAGTRTVKRWKFKHPLGHEIIGQIKVWTRQGYNTSQNIKNFKPSSTRKIEGPKSSNKQHIKPKVSESPDF